MPGSEDGSHLPYHIYFPFSPLPHAHSCCWILIPLAYSHSVCYLFMSPRRRSSHEWYFSPDHNECKNGQHTCSQICGNTPGSYYCACRPGYYLDGDFRTCKGMRNMSWGSGAYQDFSKGGHIQGHHLGIADYIWFIRLLSLVYQRAQSYYRGMN